MSQQRQVLLASKGDGELCLYDFGGSGASLLLVHGVGLHSHVFLPMTRLLGASFHCFGIDLRGHGAAKPPPGGDLSWPRLAEDVLWAVESLATPGLMCFGHSAGASAALMAEAQRPRSFGAIYCYEAIVFDPAHHGELDEEHPLVARARRRRRSFSSYEKAIEHYRSKPPFDRLDDQSLTAYVEHGFVPRPNGDIELACDPETEAMAYLGANQSDLFEKALGIRCPVVVSYGASPSDATGAQLADVLGELLSTATSVRFEGLGHFGPLEDPDRVATSVLEHFSALVASKPV